MTASKPKPHVPHNHDESEMCRLIIENTEDYAIFSVSNEGLITSWNQGAERVFGYTESEALGQRLALIFTPEDRKNGAPEQEVDKASKNGRADDERWHIRKDGTRFYASGVLVALLDETGKRKGFAKIARNKTAQKLREDELQSLNEKISRLSDQQAEFTSIVSHELRTPLAAMRESIQLVIDGVDGPVTKDQIETLNLAKNNVDRLARLINNVLAFSRAESGKIQMFIEDTDLRELMDDIFKFMSKVGRRRGLKMECDIPQYPVIAQCDSDMIRQVTINLLDNAMKYTKTGGRVVFRLTDQSDQALIQIEDTGLGISPEDQEKIFGMFTQGNGHKRFSGQQSSGVGLAVTKKLIEQHHGTITLHSEIGRGSIFSVTLPLKHNFSPESKS